MFSIFVALLLIKLNEYDTHEHIEIAVATAAATIVIMKLVLISFSWLFPFFQIAVVVEVVNVFVVINVVVVIVSPSRSHGPFVYLLDQMFDCGWLYVCLLSWDFSLWIDFFSVAQRFKKKWAFDWKDMKIDEKCLTILKDTIFFQDKKSRFEMCTKEKMRIDSRHNLLHVKHSILANYFGMYHQWR